MLINQKWENMRRWYSPTVVGFIAGFIAPFVELAIAYFVMVYFLIGSQAQPYQDVLNQNFNSLMIIFAILEIIRNIVWSFEIDPRNLFGYSFGIFIAIAAFIGFLSGFYNQIGFAIFEIIAAIIIGVVVRISVLLFIKERKYVDK